MNRTSVSTWHFLSKQGHIDIRSHSQVQIQDGVFQIRCSKEMYKKLLVLTKSCLSRLRLFATNCALVASYCYFIHVLSSEYIPEVLDCWPFVLTLKPFSDLFLFSSGGWSRNLNSLVETLFALVAKNKDMNFMAWDHSSGTMPDFIDRKTSCLVRAADMIIGLTSVRLSCVSQRDQVTTWTVSHSLITLTDTTDYVWCKSSDM